MSREKLVCHFWCEWYTALFFLAAVTRERDMNDWRCHNAQELGLSYSHRMMALEDQQVPAILFTKINFCRNKLGMEIWGSFLKQDIVAHLDSNISIDSAKVFSATQKLLPAPPTETQSFLSLFLGSCISEWWNQYSFRVTRSWLYPAAFGHLMPSIFLKLSS